jgi:hypothetical protein
MFADRDQILFLDSEDGRGIRNGHGKFSSFQTLKFLKTFRVFEL